MNRLFIILLRLIYEMRTLGLGLVIWGWGSFGWGSWLGSFGWGGHGLRSFGLPGIITFLQAFSNSILFVLVAITSKMPLSRLRERSIRISKTAGKKGFIFLVSRAHIFHFISSLDLNSAETGVQHKPNQPRQLTPGQPGEQKGCSC